MRKRTQMENRLHRLCHTHGRHTLLLNELKQNRGSRRWENDRSRALCGLSVHVQPGLCCGLCLLFFKQTASNLSLKKNHPWVSDEWPGPRSAAAPPHTGVKLSDRWTNNIQNLGSSHYLYDSLTRRVKIFHIKQTLNKVCRNLGKRIVKTSLGLQWRIFKYAFSFSSIGFIFCQKCQITMIYFKVIIDLVSEISSSIMLVKIMRP